MYARAKRVITSVSCWVCSKVAMLSAASLLSSFFFDEELQETANMLEIRSVQRSFFIVSYAFFCVRLSMIVFKILRVEGFHHCSSICCAARALSCCISCSNALRRLFLVVAQAFFSNCMKALAFCVATV